MQPVQAEQLFTIPQPCSLAQHQAHTIQMPPAASPSPWQLLSWAPAIRGTDTCTSLAKLLSQAIIYNTCTKMQFPVLIMHDMVPALHFHSPSHHRLCLTPDYYNCVEFWHRDANSSHSGRRQGLLPCHCCTSSHCLAYPLPLTLI